MEYSHPKTLKPCSMKSHEQAYSGFVFVSKDNYKKFLIANNQKTPVFITINGFNLTLSESKDFTDEEIALNNPTRQVLRITLTQNLSISLYRLPTDKEYRLSQIQLDIDLIKSTVEGKQEIDDSECVLAFKLNFRSQIFRVGQIVLFLYKNNTFNVKVQSLQMMSLGVDTPMTLTMEGMLVDESDIELVTSKQQTGFKLKSKGNKTQNLFRSDFKFEDMGIGGLDNELANIFRRAFASRRFPPNFLKKYGISHVKGVLLYGPPGTGKTLIARQLAKVLKAKELKIVNGPEIMSKFVGESEENIRKLFKESQEDQNQLGDESPLHIIVFDEIDAICKTRGTVTGSTGVSDSVVNQLLSMIDGVDSLNNILVLGMTNRKDMIDEAILRPGRFEVHIEISLPDEKGRQDIFKIHTSSMRQNKVMGEDVNLEELSKITKNYTGAEIEAVVKSATTWAIKNQEQGLMDFSKELGGKDIIVGMQEFRCAVDEIKPQFGVDNDKFESLMRTPLIDYGVTFQRIQSLIKDSVKQTQRGTSSQLHSILLEGETGTGKTSIAFWAALNCEFPFVKLISPDNFVGYTENGKINAMVKIFDDAYRSPISCIVIDNIERIIEFIDMGPRFSNPILQALLVLIKKAPQKPQHRILIIGTTNCAGVLKELEITKCFNLNIKVPPLKEREEILKVLSGFNIKQNDRISIADHAKGTPIKKLLMILDMVLSVQTPDENVQIIFESFKEKYDNVNFDN